MELLQKGQALNEALFCEGGASIREEDGVWRVFDRQQAYSSLACRVLKACPGAQRVRVSYELKAEEPVHVGLYFKVITEDAGKEYTAYSSAIAADIPNDRFVTLSAACDLPATLHYKEVIAYWIGWAGQKTDFLVRSLTVEEEGLPVRTPRPKIAPQKKTTMGAIRWDAYFDTHLSPDSVAVQVTRTLSPNRYHTHAPYFSRVTGRDSLEFPPATQEQLDEECRLAYEAGFDYFAYCWYRNNDPMSYARRQHEKSPWRNKIRMCAIIHVNALDDETMNDLYHAMAQDYYFHVDGRPVVYVFSSHAFPEKEMERFRRGTEAAGLPLPYLIAMIGESDPYTAELLTRDYDAIGAYGIGSKGSAEKYTMLCARDEERTKQWFAYKDKLGIAPSITCGLDFRPRVDHPVRWMKGRYYTLTGTAEEIGAHAQRMLEINREGGSELNTVLVYAWNEHDEGGWCCPTLTVDAMGEVVKDEQGNNVPDRSHLDALKQAFETYRRSEK